MVSTVLLCCDRPWADLSVLRLRKPGSSIADAPQISSPPAKLDMAPPSTSPAGIQPAGKTKKTVNKIQEQSKEKSTEPDPKMPSKAEELAGLEGTPKTQTATAEMTGKTADGSESDAMEKTVELENRCRGMVDARDMRIMAMGLAKLRGGVTKKK